MIYKNIELEEYTGIKSSKFVDLTGKIIEDYYIICRGPNRKSATMFWTECKCGKIELKYSYHLLNNNSKRCLQCAMDKYSEKSFKGYGVISFYYWDDLHRGAAGEKSKRKSRTTKLFEISIEDAWKLFLKQNKKCALTGLPIKFVKIGRSNKQRMKEQTASLDRIDSTKNYTLDNVQWVHKDVNRMKNVFDQNYFINICKLITNNN
jgi:hypothetical protein